MSLLLCQLQFLLLLHPAVSMATVALDCYSLQELHGNSLQPWSLGAGVIRKVKEGIKLVSCDLCSSLMR